MQTTTRRAVIDGDVAKGFCASGGYLHHADKSVAYALISRADAIDDLITEIEIMGSRRKITRIKTALFDPDGSVMPR